MRSMLTVVKVEHAGGRYTLFMWSITILGGGQNSCIMEKRDCEGNVKNSKFRFVRVYGKFFKFSTVHTLSYTQPMILIQTRKWTGRRRRSSTYTWFLLIVTWSHFFGQFLKVIMSLSHSLSSINWFFQQQNVKRVRTTSHIIVEKTDVTPEGCVQVVAKNSTIDNSLVFKIKNRWTQELQQFFIPSDQEQLNSFTKCLQTGMSCNIYSLINRKKQEHTCTHRKLAFYNYFSGWRNAL